MMALTHTMTLFKLLLPNLFNLALILNLMVLLPQSFAPWRLILLSSFKSPGPFNVPELINLNGLWLPSIFKTPWTSPTLVVPPQRSLDLSLFLVVRLPLMTFVVL